MSVYQASPVKRARRTAAELEHIQAVLYGYASKHQPVTVRQLFYAASVQGVVPKTEAGYDLVGRELVKMRRAGVLPYGWLADNTRWMRRPRTYQGLEAAMHFTAKTYRRSLWADSPVTVEVWLEKEALAGVLVDVTEEFDVPLMVTRGYPSLTYLHAAGEALAAEQRPAFVYYFGDWDPSGVDIPRKVEAGLREYAPEAEIHFERVAVNRWQIREWDLPTRPTKHSDSRARSFMGDSVEVDAIPPDDLRTLVRRYIEQHVDPRALAALQFAEREERAALRHMAAQLSGGAA